MSKKFRSVRTVLPRPPAHWVGDGFNVYPVFAHLAFKEELSPLLMFDYAAPKKFPAKLGAPLGVGQHPHRGTFQAKENCFGVRVLVGWHVAVPGFGIPASGRWLSSV